MKKIIVCTILCCSFLLTFGQNQNQKWYNHGIGVRAEISSNQHSSLGLDYVHFFYPHFGMDILVQTEFINHMEVAGMVQYNQYFPGLTPRLRWYAGGGLKYHRKIKIGDDGVRMPGNVKIAAGPVAMIGMGYSFKKLPLNISIDWRPTWNIIWINRDKNCATDIMLDLTQVGVTLRFITNRCM